MKIEIEKRWFAIWWNRKLWMAVAVERCQHSWPFEIVKEDGEWLLWFRHLHLIFTPPGWKPIQSVAITDTSPA